MSDRSAVARPIDHDRQLALFGQLQREIGSRNVDHWFRDQATLAVVGTELVIGVANPFVAQWMQRQFRHGITTAAQQVLGAGLTVRFEVDARTAVQPETPPRLTERTGRQHNAPTVHGSNASRRAPATLGSVLRQTPARHSSKIISSERDKPTENRIAFSPATAVATPAAQVSGSPHQPGPHQPKTAAEVCTARSEKSDPRNVVADQFAAGKHHHQAEHPGSEVGSSAESTKAFPETSASARAASKHNASGANESAAPPGDRGSLRTSRRLVDLADLVEGPFNELALTAARQICEAPGQRVNPLFIHGNVGTGKTVILEGIARRIRRAYPNAQVMLLSAETFANFFTEALRDKSLPSFRQKFRTVDVLLIDDVDFLDGKKVMQEEFLHTVKQLECLGRQIVVSSDRHPRLLQKSSEELVTRLLSGLVCRIESPDVESRRRIVLQKAGQLPADFAPDALTYVAQRFTGNIRELEGAMHSLATWHSVSRKKVTVAAARAVLADLERDCVKVVRMGDVEETVCRFFGITTDEMRSASRSRTVSQPRMLAMFLARKLTQAAYTEIGQHFGGRNHSTVISAERKVNEWIADGKAVRIAAREWSPAEVLETLEQQLRAC